MASGQGGRGRGRSSGGRQSSGERGAGANRSGESQGRQPQPPQPPQPPLPRSPTPSRASPPQPPRPRPPLEEPKRVQSRGAGAPQRPLSSTQAPVQALRSSRVAPESRRVSECLVQTSPSVTWASLGPVPADVAEKAQALAQGMVEKQREAVLGRPWGLGGEEGKRVTVVVNHFRLRLDLDKMDVHQYQVSMTPSSTSRVFNKAIMRKVAEMWGTSRLSSLIPAYDGRSIAFFARCLPEDPVEVEVEEDERPLDQRGTRERRSVKVKFSLVGRVDMGGLKAYLGGNVVSLPQSALQVLDIVLKERSAVMESVDVGRITFSRDFGDFSAGRGERRSTLSLSGGVEAWRGFFQSVRPTQSGLTLNADVVASAFVEPLPVPEFVLQVLKAERNKALLNRPLSAEDHSQAAAALKGKRVETTHMPYRRKYSITGISAEPTRRLTFKMKGADGSESVVTVEEYFKTTYKIVLKFPSMPCLLSGDPTSPRFLPFEVCNLVAGQPSRQKLDELQTRNMLRAASLDPVQKQNKIQQTHDLLFSSVGTNPGDRFPGTFQQASFAQADVAHQFGVDMEHEMMTASARILPAPPLQYRGLGRSPVTFEVSPGSWDMRDKLVLIGAKMHSWVAVNVGTLDEKNFTSFYQNIARFCKKSGLDVTEQPREVVQTSVDECANTLRALARRLTPEGRTRPVVDIVFCVMQDRSPYRNIKSVCERELGLLTQCCLAKNWDQKPPFFFNLVLKINTKLGGTNVNLLRDTLPKGLQQEGECVMVVGADVSHPPPGDQSFSIAAVVGSMDWPGMSQYKAVVEAQTGRKEIIENLDVIFRELLVAFYIHPLNRRRAKPTRIIFYRDGVGEGQFDSVRAEEIYRIKKACAEMPPDGEYNPALTFIITQKRHHTRLFVPDRPETSALRDKRTGNPLPGTVLDTQICNPNNSDFYLISHIGIQGTSRPTHYQVAYDENGFSADGLQALTYHLTYTYARCTKSVSMVPPAYYAHLMAYRARMYLGHDESDRMPGKDKFAGGRMLLNAAISEKMFFC